MRTAALFRRPALLLALMALMLAPIRASAAEKRVDFTEETLENGLRVIYAPLHQAPVVHVRVLYHVGSRDERPDRTGFAHMFEHMMFRGSAHVPPEEHMKLIGTVGGYSNAFTSFDQTVYINTVPANQMEMALYLEADRMSSFKVSEEIYRTERKVVGEEWRMKENRPYGNAFEQLLKTAFTTHSYRWSPIGNMQHLAAAEAGELQAFFNRFYVPNNAVLVIAGDFDPAQAKELAHKYYGWIPRGADVQRDIPAEPRQTEQRKVVDVQRVPLPMIMLAYHTPAYGSDEQYALSLAATILGTGESSRLQRLLVNTEKPLCLGASASDTSLQDSGLFTLSAQVLSGRDPAEVEKALEQAAAELAEKPVSSEELEKARTIERLGLVQSLQTAENLASQLGTEALLANDPGRVNTQLEKLNAVTAADIQAVAKKYLQKGNSTVLVVQPGDAPATQPATAPVAVSAAPAPKAEPRKVEFPAGYPQHPPMSGTPIKAQFAKGEQMLINGVQVIVMSDRRLPLVNWSLVMRQGGHGDPVGKEGLSGMTADLMRRGVPGLNFEQLNQDLESRAISLEITDNGDNTRLVGSCPTEQIEHAINRSRQVLLSPTLPADELGRLKEQTINGLRESLDRPETVATRQIAATLYPGTPLGALATPATLESITLDDVKQCYDRLCSPAGAVFVIAGDISVEQGKALAAKLLEGWKNSPLQRVDYAPAKLPAQRQIILVDRPEGRQATIRMAIPGYALTSDEKYAGALADRILSAGIDARLTKYVRAQKGLAYRVSGSFDPGRYAGLFLSGTDTSTQTTADAIESMFKVFRDMRTADVTPEELAGAKLRVSGGMVMGMQTIQQQAAYRVEGILDAYPENYFDVYPQHVAATSAEQIRQLMNRYVQDEHMLIVVVAPAGAVKEQLEKLGEVKVIPMPLRGQ